MSIPLEWTAEAEARLKEIPFFVRPAARKKIEKFAQELGITQINVEVYEQAKQKFNSKK
ncbi:MULTISPECIES: PCP reductase family protein [Kamptonema]|uniref:PCP reductase family protein n=1 Tax=Kamptonema TaxID=1501433 RepID=UPI0001DAC795